MATETMETEATLTGDLRNIESETSKPANENYEVEIDDETLAAVYKCLACNDKFDIKSSVKKHISWKHMAEKKGRKLMKQRKTIRKCVKSDLKKTCLK